MDIETYKVTTEKRGMAVENENAALYRRMKADYKNSLNEVIACRTSLIDRTRAYLKSAGSFCLYSSISLGEAYVKKDRKRGGHLVYLVYLVIHLSKEKVVEYKINMKNINGKTEFKTLDIKELQDGWVNK